MIIFTDKGENHFILSLLILFYYYYFFFSLFLVGVFPSFFISPAISHRQGTAQYLTAAAWNQVWMRMTHLQNT